MDLFHTASYGEDRAVQEEMISHHTLSAPVDAMHRHGPSIGAF